MVAAVLSFTAACIPKSSEYPYLGPSDAGPDADGADLARASDAGGDADVCIPPGNDELCEEFEAECGTRVVVDPCGSERTLECGRCGGDDVCDPDNKCCVPEDDATHCDRFDAQCGVLDARDSCGVLREGVACGQCDDGIECMGTSCGPCQAESDGELCARLGHECGTFTNVLDNCGASRNITCPACLNGAECDDPEGPATARCVCPGGQVETNCADDADNDCDGLADCADPDCGGQICGEGLPGLEPRCNESQCGL